MTRGLCALAFVAQLAWFGSSHGQVTLNTVSANIGMIRTYLPDLPVSEAHLYSVYPEIQAGGDFFTPSVRWNAYWGYWADGVTSALPIADYVTYSCASHIVGARFGICPATMLPRWPLPIELFAGVAHHFIATTYIGGSGLDGRAGRNFSAGSTTFEIGLNVEVEVLSPVIVRGEAEQYVGLGSAEYDGLQKNRRSFKIGIGVMF